MKNRLGGLAKRALYVKQNLNRAAGNLLVDAGNLLLYRKHFRANVKADAAALARRKARAELIAQAYRKMGFHGVAVGATDLVLGLDVLKSLATKHKLPLLSANLQSKAGKRLFPASRLVTVGGVKFGVFGLTGEKNISRVTIDPAQFKLADATAAAKAEVKKLRAQGAQLVIALAAVGHQDARKIAQDTPGIDFMFVSGTGRHGERADRAGTAWIMEMSREGKYAGHLQLHLRKGSYQFEDLSERYQLANRLERIEKSISDLKARMKGGAGGRGAEFMQRRLVNSENSRDRMMVQMAKANERQAKGSFFTNVAKPIAVAMPEDAEIQVLVGKISAAAGLQRPRGAK